MRRGVAYVLPQISYWLHICEVPRLDHWQKTLIFLCGFALETHDSHLHDITVLLSFLTWLWSLLQINITSRSFPLESCFLSTWPQHRTDWCKVTLRSPENPNFWRIWWTPVPFSASSSFPHILWGMCPKITWVPNKWGKFWSLFWLMTIFSSCPAWDQSWGL